MKIKEAAQTCGLTEKAIRLYESKGLITPVTEEKNGRTFRDYSEDNVRTLTTIGALRRAGFSLEQIARMQTAPACIPEVFAAYRAELSENVDRMAALANALDRVDVKAGMELDAFAAALMQAILPVDGTPDLPAEANIVPILPDEPRSYRWAVWDEGIAADEKEAAYQRFLVKYARREALVERLMAIPRAIAGLCRRLPRQLRRGIGIGMPVLLIALLILTQACLITPFTHTFTGVLYHRGDPDPAHVEPITVTFDGELRRFLWKADYFSGLVEAEGFVLYDRRYFKTLQDPALEVRLEYEKLRGNPTWEWGATIEWRNAARLSISDGWWTRGWESGENMALVLAVMEPTGANRRSWSSSEGWYIVCPAETRDDAEFLVRTYWAEYTAASADGLIYQ